MCIANVVNINLKYGVIQNDCWGTIVQRQFLTKFGKQPPSDNSIRRWYAQFQETGSGGIPELKVRIITAIETITADMLQTVWNELDYRVDVCRITKGIYRAPVRYATKTWSIVLLNLKKNIYSYLKCIVYDKLLKPRQSFWITLYNK